LPTYEMWAYVAIYTLQIQRYRVNIPKVALPTYKKPLNVIALAILGIAIAILGILRRIIGRCIEIVSLGV